VLIVKSSPKKLPKATRRFWSVSSTCWLTKSKQKRSQCRLENHHRNTFQRWRVDLEELVTYVDSEKVNDTSSKSDALTAPVDSAIVNENYVTVDSEIITKTPFKGDTWIRNSYQPLLTQKKSTKSESKPTRKSSLKHLPKVTRGFRSACSPYWLRKIQQKQSRCWLEIVTK
jgi:hypothetical protein